MDKKFTWIPIYKKLSDWLIEQKKNQPKLIDTLKEIGITGFRDGSERGKEIALEEIDPFTFFSYLNKFHSDERRVEILQGLRRKLNLNCPKPTDVSGIPTIHPMKVHLFPHKSTRNKHDINVLWELFRQVKEGKVDERLFQTAFTPQLTVIIFYQNLWKSLFVSSSQNRMIASALKSNTKVFFA